MKKLALIVCFLAISIKGFAQDFDNLMLKKQLDCSDISNSSSLLFEKYFTEAKLDSAKSLLNYWETKCGLREPVQRAKILLAIKENKYQNSLLSEEILTHIFNYQSRMNMVKDNSYYTYDNYKPYYGFIPIGQQFDTFTKKQFGLLKSNFTSDKIEYLLCDFYSGNSDNSDTLFSKIQTNKYDHSLLSKEYKKNVDKYLNMEEMHFSFITGAWIPTGNIKKLGIHPELGVQFGTKHNKMNYDLTLALRIGKAAQSYYARRSKSSNLELTNNFYGVHLGIEAGRDIYVKKAHEIQLTGGIGYDGFDPLEENKELDLKAATVSTYNFNFGLAYRYYFASSNYVGLRVKYNIVDYSLNNVVDFRGNPVTIQLTVGGVNNLFRNNNLKILKYKFRE